MNEQGYVERRSADWQRLTYLCDKAEANLKGMSKEELQEFVKLYRRASTDLALVRTKSSNVNLTDDVNDVVVRAYSVLYRAPSRSIREVLVSSIAHAAKTVRRRRAFVFASIGIFLFAALATPVLMSVVPQTQAVLIPDQYRGVFDQWKSGHFPHRSAADSIGATGMYASHNPFVAIITGAVGAGSFGLLSVYLIAENGLMIGALGHETARVGRLDFLLSSIIPHGVPELTGAFLSGSAGLLLGWALVKPGRLTRAQSLKSVGPDAITLLATSMVMMAIAAPIEGFFSFNPHVPGWLKVTVAALSLSAWLAFWTQFGKDDAA